MIGSVVGNLDGESDSGPVGKLLSNVGTSVMSSVLGDNVPDGLGGTTGLLLGFDRVGSPVLLDGVLGVVAGLVLGLGAVGFDGLGTDGFVGLGTDGFDGVGTVGRLGLGTDGLLFGLGTDGRLGLDGLLGRLGADGELGLGADGFDLAAALQTILEVGDAVLLQQTVHDAFPGSRVRIDIESTMFRVSLEQLGMLRPLYASELSDGTLRFLLLTAALLTPRPPELMILNEPETSLHPELLPALGRLIQAYGKKNQILVVTHAKPLIEHLTKQPSTHHFQLEKQFGSTQIINVDQFDLPAWKWPKR